jgi:predicted nucleic acid-binding protein
VTKYILDTFAWIEYFEGDELGKMVDELITDPKNEIFTCAAMVAEIVSKARRSGRDASIACTAIETLSKVIEIDNELAKLAGNLHAEQKREMQDFGMMDAFLLAASKFMGATIVTGDPHFEKMENVEFLKEYL